MNRVLKSIALFFTVFCFSVVLTQADGKAQAAAKKYLVLPFTVEGNKQNAYMGQSLPTVLNASLNSPGLAQRLESYEKFSKSAASGEADARKILKNSGADYLVWGNLIFLGESCTLITNVTDKSGSTTPFSRSTSMGRISADVESISNEIKGSIFGVSGLVVQRQPEQAAAAPAVVSGQEQRAPRRTPGSPNPNIRMQSGVDGESTTRRSQQLQFAARGMEICDANGDGVKEIFMIDKYNLYVFSYEGGRLKPIDNTEVNLNLTNLTIRSFDLDNNGKKYILVNAMDSEQFPRSRVYSFDGKKLHLEISNVRRFLNVVRDYQTGRDILLGQQADKYNLFRVNSITHIYKKGNRLEDGEPLRLPKDVNVFNFAYLPAGRKIDTDPKIVSISMLEKFKIWTLGNSLLHTGQEDYAGSPVYMEVNNSTRGMGEDGLTIKPMYYIPVRLIPYDFNNDGDWEIVSSYAVTVLGQIFKRYRNFHQAEIHSLYYDGTSMAQHWATRPISGGVVDMAITDIDDNGVVDLIACINIGSELTERKTQIIVYEMDFSQMDSRTGEGNFVRK